jgi:hypothetical protein
LGYGCPANENENCGGHNSVENAHGSDAPVAIAQVS